MRKMPTLFVRDWNSTPKHVTREVNPECRWAYTDPGVRALRKYDGTCVAYLLGPDGPAWWSRREVKPGKTAPAGFAPISTDSETGKTIGWEPIAQSAFAKWHAEALANAIIGHQGEPSWPIGTYELVGPKINGNPENEDGHQLIHHEGAEEVFVHLGDFDIVREQLISLWAVFGCEGVVWRHPDGRLAKLKAKDFDAPEAAR